MKRWGLAGLGLSWALACANPMAPEPEPEPTRPLRERVERMQNALLHVPETRPGTPMPLVVVLHGGDGRRMVPLFEDHFDDGVLFLFPTGERDVEVVRKLIRRVRDKHEVDDARIFVVGHGSGGALAFRLGCEDSDLVDGVGVVSQTMPRDLAGRCEPDQPLPLVLVAGTEDERVLWTGRDAMLGVMETVERWFEIGGCDPESGTEQVLDDLDVDDGVRVKQHDWTCTDAPVRLYELSGGGHGWPGAREREGKAGKPKGRTARDIEGADVLLAFLLEA